MVKTIHVVALAIGAYFLWRGTQAAQAAVAPLASLGQLGAGLFQIPAGVGALFAPPPQPNYADLVESMQAEFQEHLGVQEAIRQHERTVGAPPVGFRYVQSDVGIGVLPSRPISQEEVTAGLPQAIAEQIDPRRIAYQAQIGIPIRMDAPRRDPYIPSSLGQAARAEAIAYSEQAAPEAAQPAQDPVTPPVRASVWYASSSTGAIIGDPAGYPSLAAARAAERAIGR